MLVISILLFSLIFDGLLTNYLPFLVNDLSWFTPLFTLTSILIIYPFYRKKETKYYILIFIVGIIYDLLYTNLLFLNAILFLIIALISKIIHKNFQINFFKIIIYTIIIVSLYESLTALIIIIFNLVPMTFYKLFYKITHSLIINIIYIEFIYLILKIIPKKFKKISIN